MFLQSSLEIIFVIGVVFREIADFRFRKEALFFVDVGPWMDNRVNLSLVFSHLGWQF